MSTVATSKLFTNYSKLKPLLPAWLWLLARLAALAIAGAVASLLFLKPELGLSVFWGLFIPIVPALVVLAPGIWRQVCPMAMTNQIPRQAGFSLGKDLPDWLRDRAFSIAVALFFTAVALRVPLLNRNGPVLAGGLLAALVLPFLGGLVFKGRSGWCGTFCPLAPIQRDYGHAPLAVVRNGYCPTCVGCQKNCYDFNPRAAIFADVYDEDSRYSGQRQFFMGMMPGMILGYFLQGAAPGYGEPRHFLILLAATCASAGFYWLTVNFFDLTAFRAANLFAVLAIAIFYDFAGPNFLNALDQIAGLNVPPVAVDASRGLGVLLGALVLVQGWRNERVYEAAQKAAEGLRIDESRQSLKDRLSSLAATQVTETSSGSSFPVAPGQTLLEAMEVAGVQINFGCRSGLCGADAVAICEGGEHLSVPGDDELTTLRRLGLEGQARLACMCQVKGPVTIDVDPHSAGARDAPKITASAAEDLAAAHGVGKVVIIGNGVAGLGAAEALRGASASIEIAVVTDEPHHFYNRMAIGRMIYGRTAMEGLFLLPDDWYAAKKIDVWRNTLAISIDREARIVRLGTGEALPYDRLILATGAKSALPTPNYASFSNAYVLRSANDALEIRARIQRHGARKAVVLGGGVLGVEAADALHHLGLEVTILQRSGRLMDRQLDEIGALKLMQYLEAIGVRTRTHAVVEEFIGDGALREIRLTDGERISGDMFVASVGLAPNVELARSCGLEVGRGVKVDEKMQTSDPAIFAIGDVAERAGQPSGLWPIAAAQARTAAAALLGGEDCYRTPPLLLLLKCDGIDLRSYGDVEPREGDRVLCAEQDQDVWWKLILRDGALAGAVFVGPPRSSRDFTGALKAGADLPALYAALGVAPVPA